MRIGIKISSGGKEAGASSVHLRDSADSLAGDGNEPETPDTKSPTRFFCIGIKISRSTAIINRHAGAGVRAGGRLGTLRCARPRVTRLTDRLRLRLRAAPPIVPQVAGLQLRQGN